ncbi:Hypothetical_protein [Hexamita inflata]|uniref:Hypothetical_protein n=1 Tax=Hexamita inflata TaxID=28002 RepID=A0AA86N8P2_9EUKA|nr:Hypothetical protein HINF_LOCUS2411 [Hexamita inflata]
MLNLSLRQHRQYIVDRNPNGLSTLPATKFCSIKAQAVWLWEQTAQTRVQSIQQHQRGTIGFQCRQPVFNCLWPSMVAILNSAFYQQFWEIAQIPLCQTLYSHRFILILVRRSYFYDEQYYSQNLKSFLQPKKQILQKIYYVQTQDY